VQTFVVECYWPRIVEGESWEVPHALFRVGREDSLADAVRSIGCILVPSDGMALFLFSAPSEDAVTRVGQLAEIPFDRIVESILVGFGQPARDAIATSRMTASGGVGRRFDSGRE